MVDATKSQLQKLDLLYSKEVTSTPASGTIARIGEEDDADLILLKQEVAEIVYVEIETPLDGVGDAENLEQIKLIIDGKEWFGDTFQIKADNDNLIAVPRDNVTNDIDTGKEGSRQIFKLGNSMPELLRMGIESNPHLILTNTTAKVREAGKINVEYKIGNSAITDNFKVRMYGVKYTNLDVAQWYMNRVYGGSRRVAMTDAKTGRQFSTTIRPSSLNVSAWTALLGGNDMKLAGDVEVKPLLRWTRNGVATTASKELNLSFQDNNVDEPENNMDFDIDDETLYLITHLGVNPHANHKFTRLKANGIEVFRDSIEDGKNHYGFGRITGFAAGVEPSDHEYEPLATIDTVYGHNETLKVSIEDDGNVIPDGTAFKAGSTVVIAGYVIKDQGFKAKTPNLFTPGV